MKITLDKCALICIHKSKLSENHCRTSNSYPDGSITYQLAFLQKLGISYKNLKGELSSLYKLLNTKLDSRNLFNTINDCAVPVLTNLFGVIK